MKFYILHFTFFIFFIGCATKTEPIFVTIKSPKIKISDEGFFERGLGYKKIVIYKLGAKPIVFILKKGEICVNKECFNKYLFIEKVFKIENKNFFDTILEQKPFNGVPIKRIDGGFIQKGPFFYKVQNNETIFKNRQIIIFIKKIKKEKK